MVTCGRQNFNMLPMAPTSPFVSSSSSSAASTSVSVSVSAASASASAAASKPKLAFSIDSIVGETTTRSAPLRVSVISSPPPRSESPASPTNTNTSGRRTPRGFIYCRRRDSLDRSRSPPRSPTSRSPTPPNASASPRKPVDSQQPGAGNPPPAQIGTLIRPLPLPAPNLALIQNRTSPTSLAIRSAGAPPPPPPFLAAQFQMAAALAHHHQQQQQQQQGPHPHPPVPTGPPHGPHPHLPPGQIPLGLFPGGPHPVHPSPHGHHPFGGPPHLIRDSYPLYPWLISRHGRIFPRFPGSKYFPKCIF